MPQENSYTTQDKVLMVAAPILLILLLVGISILAPKTAPLQAIVIESIEEAPKENTFEGVATIAEAAVVWDVRNEKLLYSKHEDIQLPLASLTKLVTTHLAVARLGSDTTISIAAVDLVPEGDSGLLVDEVWTVGDLAAFTLMTSSNDGAQALARALYEATNTPPERLFTSFGYNIGLSQSYFLNGTGLDTSDTISGGYGSAEDVARLIAYIYEHTPELLEVARKSQETFTSVSGFVHEAQSTNMLANTLPQLLGAKTGFTDLAGGNLAVLFEVAPNRPIAIVVLGSTLQGRFADVELLTKHTVEYFAQ